jgi:ribosome biogenesis GTPase
MELEDLGFDDWFLQESQISENTENSIARIAAVDKNQFLIINEKTTIAAEVTGKLIYGAESVLDFPTVGDWVKVQYFNKKNICYYPFNPAKKIFIKEKNGWQ